VTFAESYSGAPPFPPPLWLNSGGPSSRTRKERIQATLLGREEGHVRCPRILRIGLRFDPLADAVGLMTKILRKQGLRDPESLRDAYAIPGGRLIATPLAATAPRLDARYDEPRAVLEQALLLGLCTAHLYDPGRPVLWTTASLRRGLELFDPAGFYA